MRKFDKEEFSKCVPNTIDSCIKFQARFLQIAQANTPTDGNQGAPLCWAEGIPALEKGISFPRERETPASRSVTASFECPSSSAFRLFPSTSSADSKSCSEFEWILFKNGKKQNSTIKIKPKTHQKNPQSSKLHESPFTWKKVNSSYLLTRYQLTWQSECRTGRNPTNPGRSEHRWVTLVHSAQLCWELLRMLNSSSLH